MSRAGRWAGHTQLTGAVLLVLGYLQEVLLTLQSMTLVKGDAGWAVQFHPAAVPKDWAVLGLLMVLCGLLLFGGGYLAKRLRPRLQQERSRLTFRDLLLAFGWVGLAFFGALFLYSIVLQGLVPASWTNNAGAAALSGVLLQILAILVIPIYYRKSLAEIGLRGPVLTWKMALYVGMFLLFLFAASIGTTLLGDWLNIDTNSYREQNISAELQSSQEEGGWLLTLLPLLTTAVIAPVGEELLFRGALQSTLTARFGAKIGVFLSAFLFSFIHADPVLFLPIFLIGLLFGWIYRITGTLWAPIWLHVLNNLWASLLDLL